MGAERYLWTQPDSSRSKVELVFRGLIKSEDVTSLFWSYGNLRVTPRCLMARVFMNILLTIVFFYCCLLYSLVLLFQTQVYVTSMSVCCNSIHLPQNQLYVPHMECVGEGTFSYTNSIFIIRSTLQNLADKYKKMYTSKSTHDTELAAISPDTSNGKTQPPRG